MWSVSASVGTSRRPPQDLGSGWLAMPFLWDSCIPDCLPVHPGAPALAIVSMQGQGARMAFTIRVDSERAYAMAWQAPSHAPAPTNHRAGLHVLLGELPAH